MEIRFDDYNAYPDSDIRAVTEAGIELSTGQFIDFARCAANSIQSTAAAAAVWASGT